MKRFISDFGILLVAMLAIALWVVAWSAGVSESRRQVDELASAISEAEDKVRTMEYSTARMKARVGSAAAEILERRMTPEESYELLLRILKD